MPAISRIRFTNVVYDGGRKRYIDTTFQFDGFNGILLLENGAGKTVFVQTLIQAVLPHKTVAQRKIQETLQLSNTTAHIAVEWILEEQPRRYALTLVSLFMNSKDALASQEFAYEYGPGDRGSIDQLPLSQREDGRQRPATKEEMATFCRNLAASSMNARFFGESDSLQSYGRYIEEHFHIIPAEWHKIAAINETEGGVEAFFANCRTNDTLVGRLLIPTVEEGLADENGHAPGEGNGFAELFATQREHFRKQRHLQKQIAEMQGVVERLAGYTEVQHAKYLVANELDTANGQLKVLYQRLHQIKDQRQEQAQTLQTQAGALQQEQAQLTQNIEACDVLASAQAAAAQQALDQQAQRDYQAATEKLRQQDSQLQSLRLAKLQQEQMQARQAEQSLAAQIEELANDRDTQELQQQLTRNGSQLHYYFQRQEQGCQERLEKLAVQNQELAQTQANAHQKLAELAQAETQLNRRLGECSASIHTAVEQMEQIEQHIFDDSLNQDAATQRRLWEQQLQQVRAQLADDQKNLDFYTEQKQTLQAKLPAERQQLAQLQRDAQDLTGQLSAIDSAAGELLQELQQFPTCANMVSNTLELYQRADFLSNQLGDSFIKETEKRKRLSFTCRQAHRFVDVYGEAASFTADPLLPELIQDWQKDFSVLQSGVEAFQAACRAGQDAQELWRRYAFWPAALITSEDSTAELLRRLRTQAPRLTAPVFVLSSGELRTILNDGGTPQQPQAVLPDYWQHLEADAFQQWLADQRAEASQRDAELTRQETLCNQLSQTHTRLKKFYTRRPFSEYQELQNSQQQIANRTEILQKNLQDSEQSLEQCQRYVENYQRDYYTQQKLQDELEHQLQELTRYEQLQTRHREALAQQQSLRTELRQTQEHSQQEQRRVEALAAQMQDLAQNRGAIAMQREQLRHDIYYAEVQALAPLEDARSYEVLADERRQLKSRLDGIQQNRGRLEERLLQTRKDQQRLSRDIAQLQKEARERALTLDETLTYPPDGQLLEEKIHATRQELATDQAAKQQAYTRSHERYSKAAGRAESIREHYDERYSDLPDISGDPDTQKQLFQDQLRGVGKSLQACQQKTQDNNRQLKQVESILNELGQHNVTLQFTLDSVTAAMLPEAWQTLDSAVFQQAYPPLLRTAGEIFARYQQQCEKTDAARDTFIKYCEQHIREEKRRRQIVDGIRAKDSYAEYETWRATLLNTIQKSIAIAEAERKGHYEHIEHMVEHMSLYLQEIGQGLKEIATKTRIRTQGQSKDIYTIHFVEKPESERRTAIRSYLSTLTERLDTEAFLDEDGREDSRKIKEELQKKLSTQQLLYAVLGTNAIKVKCRKATSAATFSERPYDWEESNKWSGGEAWCKNMALFLGCLNYLSEKRVRLPRSKTNNRVVVADNPFGKASSDHVLDPVFFIAEQLGFQVLALTAHEDGNFVRKYFPIIYSCRFAELAHGQGKVLEPERQIKTAFFAEKHPETLERLEQITEMSLFEQPQE